MKFVIVSLVALGCALPCPGGVGKERTPYEMLIESRGQNPALDAKAVGSTGPVVARAELRLTRPGGRDHVSYFDLQMATTTIVKPPQVYEIPADAPKEPVYFVIRAGGRELTGTTYRSTQHRNAVKMYLDTDGDGSWSDEVEYLGTWQRWLRLETTYIFGPISTEPDGAQGQPEGGVFYAQCAGGKRVVLYPVFYRRGPVTLEGKRYDVALVDTNFDGRYDNWFAPPARGRRSPGSDVLIVDLNRDSQLNFSGTEASEFMPLSRLVQIGGVYYSLDVAAEGSSIEFRRAQIQCGTLDLGGAEAKLTLWSDAARQYLTGSDKWSLPVGRYSAVELELIRKDSAGDRWRFTMENHSMGDLGDFEIRPGRTTSFRLGAPFQIRTSMESVDKNLVVSFSLEGQAGQRYEPGAMKNGKMVPAPAFEILDTAGKVAHAGRFKYG